MRCFVRFEASLLGYENVYKKPLYYSVVERLGLPGLPFNTAHKEYSTHALIALEFLPPYIKKKQVIWFVVQRAPPGLEARSYFQLEIKFEGIRPIEEKRHACFQDCRHHDKLYLQTAYNSPVLMCNS